MELQSFFWGAVSGAIVTITIVYFATRQTVKNLKSLFADIDKLQRESSELLDKIEKAV